MDFNQSPTRSPSQSDKRIYPGPIHAIRRAEERYGITLTREQIADMERLAVTSDPRAVRLTIRSDKTVLIAFHAEGQWIATIFQEDIGKIRTVVPLDDRGVYHAFLKTIDPETGRKKEVQPASQPTVSRGRDAKTALKPRRSPFRPLGDLFAMTVGELAEEKLRIQERIVLLREWRDRLKGQPDLARARKEDGAAMAECHKRLGLIRELIWWSEYDELCRTAGIDDPEDLNKIHQAVGKLIASLFQRLNYDVTEQDRAVRDVFCRFTTRSSHERPVAPLPDDELDADENLFGRE